MQNALFLTNTDTTIGFVSKNRLSLDRAKKRAPKKKYITALPSLRALSKRVPQKYRKMLRRSSKTTFIINGYSFRIIKEKKHLLLLERLGWSYTSSANESNREYNYNYAFQSADVIIYPLPEVDTPSKIYELGKTKLKRLR